MMMTEIHLFVQIFEREKFTVSRLEATPYGFDVIVEDLHGRSTLFVFGKDGNFKFFTTTP